MKNRKELEEEFIQKLIELTKTGKIIWKIVRPFNVVYSLEDESRDYSIYCKYFGVDDRPTIIVFKNPGSPKKITMTIENDLIKDLINAIIKQIDEKIDTKKEIMKAIKKIEKK